MATMKTKPMKEVRYKNYPWIQRSVLSKRKSNGAVLDIDLFCDPTFPPDLSSLTYVYSGDDRYEKMQFKRPKDINSGAVMFGVGGVLSSAFPWKHYRKRKWLEAATVIVSLCVPYLEKLIPGYRLCEQGFGADYVGAFHFNIWRFGEWIEVVVDDFLPVFEKDLIYCDAFGSPPEFWPPLLEKAYAKLMQTYEAIECGKTLDALTDFTGAVCEYYSPDINPPEQLFHILYKSTCNRSFMVCWRNEKRLTYTGFHHSTDNEVDEDFECRGDKDRFLHIVTAASKFPTTDGRLLELVRLKCPYPTEPRWHGKFSDRDSRSWETLKNSWLDKCHPLMCKESDEYWMLFEDFRCNFGGLVICSSNEPFRVEGFNVPRVYNNGKDYERACTRNALLTTRCHSGKEFPDEFFVSKRGSRGEILVKESIKTVKVDSTISRRYSSYDKTAPFEDSSDKLATYLSQKRNSYGLHHRDSIFTRLRRAPQVSHNKIENFDRVTDRLDCAVSVNSTAETESTYSTSDISVHILDNWSRNNSLITQRNISIMDLPRKHSTGSVSHLTHSNFLATKTDNYRSQGSWKLFLEHHDVWTKSMSPGSRDDMILHSRNPRINFSVAKLESLNEPVTPTFRGKSHVIISLLQDYRNGPSTANSLLVPIGLCVYKTKCPDRDEKRSLSKLQLVCQLESKGDSREVNGRFDLDEGHYIIVPYCIACGYEGNFLVRVLGEKDSLTGKSGCAIS